MLAHTRVITTERYTHVATLQLKNASERISEALWRQGQRNGNPNCDLWPLRESGSVLMVLGEGLRAAEDRGFEPRRVLPPNRISSPFPWAQAPLSYQGARVSAQFSGHPCRNPSQAAPSAREVRYANPVPTGRFVMPRNSGPARCQ